MSLFTFPQFAVCFPLAAARADHLIGAMSVARERNLPKVSDSLLFPELHAITFPLIVNEHGVICLPISPNQTTIRTPLSLYSLSLFLASNIRSTPTCALRLHRTQRTRHRVPWVIGFIQEKGFTAPLPVSPPVL